jgi:hypothetical protein
LLKEALLFTFPQPPEICGVLDYDKKGEKNECEGYNRRLLE